MKIKNKGVYLFILGVILAGIDFTINTGISYGFKFGFNEGIRRGANTYFLEALIGEQFRLDIFFDPLGYLLMFWGLVLLGGYGKYIRNAKIFSAAGCIAGIIKTALPFSVSQYHILEPLLICIAAEVLSMIIILYSFTLACKKQVDNYTYMEVGKDLTFATELYGFATVISYIILPFAALYIYFARGAFVLVIILSYAAILYYAYKVIKYAGKLHLFEENSNEIKK